MENDHELLIRLDGKVDAILEKLKDLPILENRVRDLEIDCTEIDRLGKRVDGLEKKSDTWNVLNSIAVGIAAVLGYILP
jgi:hypothetical protein